MKHRFTYKHIILIFFLSFCTLAHGKVFKVCTVDIPNAMTSDGKGPQPLLNFYNKVIEKVKIKTGHEFKLQFNPAKRCENLFIEKQADIVWPFIVSEDVFRVKKAGYKEIPIYSMPIIMGGYYIFTRKDSPKISSVKNLNGKSVVGPRGYGMPKGIIGNSKIKIHEVNKNSQIPKMIKSKRVYAGVIQTGWLSGLEKKGLLKELHHGEVIDFWGGSFTFQFTQEGVILANTFTNIILELINDGTYEKLVKKAPYYIPSYRAKR